jgi:hypothetical protein
LRRVAVGDQKIALTTERSVAEYFACNAVFANKDPRNKRLLPGAEIAGSCGVVLVLDGEGLLANNYNLVPYGDPIWGQGEYDWKKRD